MIVDSIVNISKYLSDDNQKVIQNILNDYSTYDIGDHKVNDVILFKNVKSKTKEEDIAKIESHNHHIDIQIPLDQKELYYYYHGGIEENSEYDEVKDIIFYKSTNKQMRSAIFVPIGSFILFEAKEVHQPQIAFDGIHDIKKLVIKIRVDQ